MQNEAIGKDMLKMDFTVAVGMDASLIKMDIFVNNMNAMSCQ